MRCKDTPWIIAMALMSLMTFTPACDSSSSDAGEAAPAGGGSEGVTNASQCPLVTLGGDFSLVGPNATLTSLDLDGVSAQATHKVDIDPEDQCLSSIQIVLSSSFEGDTVCRLTLSGSSLLESDPSKILLSAYFSADSFCKGFLDSDEGTYAGMAGTAEVDAAFESAGSDICVSTTIEITLSGTLTHTETPDKTIQMPATIFTVTGNIRSSGSTEQNCMAVGVVAL